MLEWPMSGRVAVAVDVHGPVTEHSPHQQQMHAKCRKESRASQRQGSMESGESARRRQWQSILGGARRYVWLHERAQTVQELYSTRY